MIKYEKSLVQVIEEHIDMASLKKVLPENNIFLQIVDMDDNNPAEMVVMAFARSKVTKEEASLKQRKIYYATTQMENIVDAFQNLFFDKPFMDYERDYIAKLEEQYGIESEKFREEHLKFLKSRRPDEYWEGLDKKESENEPKTNN